MQRVCDVQTVWYTGWNSGMAWGEVVWLRGGYGPAWWNCGLVRTMDFCFPVLLFYNNFN